MIDEADDCTKHLNPHIDGRVELEYLSNNQTDRCKKCLFFVTDSQEKNHRFFAECCDFLLQTNRHAHALASYVDRTTTLTSSALTST